MKFLRELFHNEIFSLAAQAAVLEELPPKTFVLNSQYNVVYVNKNAEKRLEYTEKELIGKRLDFIFPNGYRVAFTNLLHEWSDVGYVNRRDMEMFVITKSGTVFPCEVTVVSKKIIDTFYCIVIVRDITKWREREQMHSKEIEMYKNIEITGEVGGFYWDIATFPNKVITSSGFDSIFDVQGSGNPAAFFMERVIKSDREMVASEIEKAFEEQSDYVIPSYRIMTHGEVRPITCIAKAVKNEDGKLIAYKGFIKFID